MKKNKRALLFGMLLGDGCLKRKLHTKFDNTVSTYYEYVICHSSKQEEYLKYKRDLFHSLIGGKEPKIHFENVQLGDQTHISCRFSKCHKLFRLFHKQLYSNNNKKYFTRKILNHLNPEAIAIWYMDDGSAAYSKRPDGTISSVQMRLYTYCSEIEVNTILTYFKEVWNIEGKKKLYTKSNQWNIVFNTKEGKKFDDLIKDYVIPSMYYKLPSKIITRAPISLKEDDDIV